MNKNQEYGVWGQYMYMDTNMEKILARDNPDASYEEIEEMQKNLLEENYERVKKELDKDYPNGILAVVYTIEEAYTKDSSVISIWYNPKEYHNLSECLVYDKKYSKYSDESQWDIREGNFEGEFWYDEGEKSLLDNFVYLAWKSDITERQKKNCLKKIDNGKMEIKDFKHYFDSLGETVYKLIGYDKVFESDDGEKD